jgi:hypothetical protein
VKKIKNPFSKKSKNDSGKLPRITTDTLDEQRDEVLSSARKYILPLQHTKHRIIVVTTTLFVGFVVAFFAYTTIALYRLQGDSLFLYRVTQVIPFPLARIGSNFIAYENYLFELRHYIHYYETQQGIDFSTEAGQQQLDEFRRRALEKVINDAYIAQLATENNVSVSDAEIDQQIEVVRSQNRLGGDERVLEDVLRDFWNWSMQDFRRSLRQQLTAQKVAAALDTETNQRADQALSELAAGSEFAQVAEKYSDDIATQSNGGEFASVIDRTDRDLSAVTTRELFELEPGETSEIINIGYALQILKNIESKGNKIRGAHILFTFKDISGYINDLREQQPARVYITIPEPVVPETPAGLPDADPAQQ